MFISALVSFNFLVFLMNNKVWLASSVSRSNCKENHCISSFSVERDTRVKQCLSLNGPCDAKDIIFTCSVDLKKIFSELDTNQLNKLLASYYYFLNSRRFKDLFLPVFKVLQEKGYLEVPNPHIKRILGNAKSCTQKAWFDIFNDYRDFIQFWGELLNNFGEKVPYGFYSIVYEVNPKILYALKNKFTDIKDFAKFFTENENYKLLGSNNIIAFLIDLASDKGEFLQYLELIKRFMNSSDKFVKEKIELIGEKFNLNDLAKLNDLFKNCNGCLAGLADVDLETFKLLVNNLVKNETDFKELFSNLNFPFGFPDQYKGLIKKSSSVEEFLASIGSSEQEYF